MAADAAGLPNHRLETVYRHLFGEICEDVQMHRADDARLTARIWMEMEGKVGSSG